jgi:integrase
MRGTLKQRYAGSWSLILDLGYEVEPETGRKKRRQKWITFRGTRKQAEAELTERVRAANRGEFVEPSRSTLGEWLTEWLTKAITPPLKSQATFDSYKRIVETQIVPKLGGTRLQALKPLDIEAYYSGLSGLSSSTVQIHHAILHSALKAAVHNGLVTRNVAALVSNKPRKVAREDVLDHVWTADEAARFLKTAKAAGPQPAAFYTLALDTGARRGELAALQWSDVDLISGKLTIRRTLLKGGRTPVFGTTKTGTIRTLELSAESVALLAAHKKQQAEVKLRNRRHYHDLGLVFAKEWGDLHQRADSLGLPLQVNTIGSREFGRLIKASGVKRIKFHGLRHTCATLMLSAGVPAHVVQRRLGHSKVEMTLNTYSHVLPSMQQDAAGRLAALLHG